MENNNIIKLIDECNNELNTLKEKECDMLMYFYLYGLATENIYKLLWRFRALKVDTNMIIQMQNTIIANRPEYTKYKYKIPYIVVSKNTSILYCVSCNYNNKCRYEPYTYSYVARENITSTPQKTSFYYHHREVQYASFNVGNVEQRKICTTCLKGYIININGIDYKIKCKQANHPRNLDYHIPYEERCGIDLYDILLNL